MKDAAPGKMSMVINPFQAAVLSIGNVDCQFVSESKRKGNKPRPADPRAEHSGVSARATRPYLTVTCADWGGTRAVARHEASGYASEFFVED